MNLNEARANHPQPPGAVEVEEDDFYPNGIRAKTGKPLTALLEAGAAAAEARPPDEQEVNLANDRLHNEQPSFGLLIGEVERDPNNLAEAGWGIVFPAQPNQDIDAIKRKLQPLLERRAQEAGHLFRVFENSDAYLPGETCAQWLARHNVSFNPVDPELGVPFYLMLVGSPEEIPFEFQYQLDVYWAVGRLYFDEVDDYGRYAESVVNYEKDVQAPNVRSAAIFATSHDFDEATQKFTRDVALPLAEGNKQYPPLGSRLNYRLETFIGKAATKENLRRLLAGRTQCGRPALLLTGTHGMVFEPDDAQLKAAQGALVCDDWAGYGRIGAADYFAAEDIPDDARVHGLIHFIFACYGAGCPQFDDFPDQLNTPGQQIAPRQTMARLPQKLLAHPNGGALAVLGHVDRAWIHSFRSVAAVPQTQGFRDVMGRLLRGDRIGQATDQFDVRRAALSSELADVLRKISFGVKVRDRELVRLWVARNDARNYVVLGDPAVRLRESDLV